MSNLKQEANQEMQGKNDKKKKLNKYTVTELSAEISRLEGANAQSSVYFKQLQSQLQYLKSIGK